MFSSRPLGTENPVQVRRPLPFAPVRCETCDEPQDVNIANVIKVIEEISRISDLLCMKLRCTIAKIHSDVSYEFLKTLRGIDCEFCDLVVAESVAKWALSAGRVTLNGVHVAMLF
jgi:hypothetical protein